MTYKELVSNVENKVNFTFTRYGDGEFGVMTNRQNVMNVLKKRHGTIEPYVDIRKRLYEILTSKPKYIVGLQPKGMREFGSEVRHLVEQLPNTCNSDILHHASSQGVLRELTDALKDRYVIMIGREYLSKLPFVDKHIVTPPTRVWNHTNEYVHKLKENKQKKIKNFKADRKKYRMLQQ